MRRATSSLLITVLLHQPGITAPVIGTSKMYQLGEVVAATDISLTPEELAHLEGLYQTRPVLAYE